MPLLSDELAWLESETERCPNCTHLLVFHDSESSVCGVASCDCVSTWDHSKPSHPLSPIEEAMVDIYALETAERIMNSIKFVRFGETIGKTIQWSRYGVR